MSDQILSNFETISDSVDCVYKSLNKFSTELEDGIVMYDALTKKEMFVQCPILCVACDNPRASEFTHHLGCSARHFCRTCDVGFEQIITKLCNMLN
jgi:hypothetical protein